MSRVNRRLTRWTIIDDLPFAAIVPPQSTTCGIYVLEFADRTRDGHYRTTGDVWSIYFGGTPDDLFTLLNNAVIKTGARRFAMGLLRKGKACSPPHKPTSSLTTSSLLSATM
ncbi:MAG: hypothetical protein LBH13_00940 [Cellulomonadaceae bacterium]|jgi:hypothetical protein|nr:hypothetical protein [Cellulomonadaceae bacterium]